MQLAIWLAADEKLTPPPPARHIRPSQPGPEPPHADTPVPQPQGTPVRVHPVAHPVNAKWSFRCNCNTMLTSIPIKREPARHAAFAQGKITVINTVRLAAQATTMRSSSPTIGGPTIGGPKIGGREKTVCAKHHRRNGMQRPSHPFRRSQRVTANRQTPLASVPRRQ